MASAQGHPVTPSSRYQPVSVLNRDSAGQVPRDWLCPCVPQLSQLLLQLVVAVSQGVIGSLGVSPGGS